jgi:protein SCO1/2
MAALKLALLAVLVAFPVYAREPGLDAETAYAKSQAAIGRMTGNHLLTDHRNRPLALGDLRGKPLVVSLVFTSCATVCPITTDHLRNQILRVRRALGEDSFNVLTFGFDARGDTPAQLAGFAGTHGIAGTEGWHIASADPKTTAAFLEELGFSFRAAAGGFDHVTQTTILDPGGRVYRQLYGGRFPLPVLAEPLKELVLGASTRSFAPTDLWNRISFLCTVYNPLTGAYRFDYGIFFGIFFGALSLILTAVVLFRLWLERRRALRTDAGLRGRAA